LVSIPASKLVEDMRSIINNKTLSDVTFNVEGREIYATRAHLAARSDHFRALFYGGLRETSRPNEPVKVHDISYEGFMLIMEYMYTDLIPNHISVENAVELLIAAERYLLGRLKSLCEDLIRKSIDFDNVIQILLTAKKHRADGLVELCMDFVVEHETKLKALPQFKDLTEEPILLYELLMRRKAIEERPQDSRGGQHGGHYSDRNQNTPYGANASTPGSSHRGVAGGGGYNSAQNIQQTPNPSNRGSPGGGSHRSRTGTFSTPEHSPQHAFLAATQQQRISSGGGLIHGMIDNFLRGGNQPPPPPPPRR